jgi:hypothetical protein
MADSLREAGYLDSTVQNERLLRYALERLLYRLSISNYQHQYFLVADGTKVT